MSEYTLNKKAGSEFESAQSYSTKKQRQKEQKGE
jgi:hypothetical protein